MSAFRLLALLSLPLTVGLVGCPSEDPGPGPVTDDDDTVIPGNSSPTAPGLAITPAVPEVEDTLECVIATESVDPDGDDVVYAYRWLKDDVETTVTTATVPPSETGAEEFWTCLVSASDGTLGSQEASVTVEVGHVNQAPTAPTVELTPESPLAREGLTCVGSGSTDLEEAPITYSYAWEVDGADAGITSTTVDATATTEGEDWTCIVTASDGELSTSAEATVTIGPACYALDLDGGTHVEVADAPDLRLSETDFTVEAWVKRTGTSGSQHAIAYKRGTTNDSGWGLYIAIDNAIQGHFAWVQSRGGDPSLDADTQENAGAWLHVAYTYAYDAGSGMGTGSLWVDGLPAGSDMLPPPNASADAPLNIGRDGGFDAHYFDGRIDDVRISSVVRYDSIFSPSTSYQPDGDTLAFWRFEEGTGTLAADASGGGHDGTIVGGAWSDTDSACDAVE